MMIEFILLIFLVISTCAFISGESSNSFAVFGYLPEYRVSDNYDYYGLFSMGLTHLIFFSLEVLTVYLITYHK